MVFETQSVMLIMQAERTFSEGLNVLKSICDNFLTVTYIHANAGSFPFVSSDKIDLVVFSFADD